jgi:quinol monooxygenase YgiN
VRINLSAVCLIACAGCLMIAATAGAEDGSSVARAELTQTARASAPADARVFVVAYLEVLPSSESAAIALLKSYRDANRKDEGNLHAEALRQIGRVGHFAVVETWTNERAFTAHRGATHTKQFLEKLRPLRVSAYDERSHTSLAMGSPLAAPPAAAIQVVTHVDIIPPGETKAGAMLKELAEASRKEEGNVRFDVLQGVRANHFTVLEAWRNEKALEAHAMAAHTKKFREEVYPMALNGSPYDERLYEALSR